MKNIGKSLLISAFTAVSLSTMYPQIVFAQQAAKTEEQLKTEAYTKIGKHLLLVISTGTGAFAVLSGGGAATTVSAGAAALPAISAASFALSFSIAEAVMLGNAIGKVMNGDYKGAIKLLDESAAAVSIGKGALTAGGGGMLLWGGLAGYGNDKLMSGVAMGSDFQKLVTSAYKLHGKLTEVFKNKDALPASDLAALANDVSAVMKDTVKFREAWNKHLKDFVDNINNNIPANPEGKPALPTAPKHNSNLPSVSGGGGIEEECYAILLQEKHSYLNLDRSKPIPGYDSDARIVLAARQKQGVLNNKSNARIVVICQQYRF